MTTGEPIGAMASSPSISRVDVANYRVSAAFRGRGQFRRGFRRSPIPLLALPVAIGLLAGCVATAPKVETVRTTGAAAGGASVGGDATLQTCLEPVGTVRLFDGMSTAASLPQPSSDPRANNALTVMMALRGMSNQGGGARPSGSGGNFSLDSLRLLIQQSNCFLIVDRGFDETAANDEISRTRYSGEVRDGANMGPGQEVAADFVLRSNVLRLEGTESSSFGGGGASGGGGKGILGRLSGSSSKSEAEVQLIVQDVRSKIQVAVAHGEGSGTNTSLATNLIGGKFGKTLGGSFGSQSKTSNKTILLQAFADAYNKLVPALVNYKMQVVRGGLGMGGTLKVQDARSDPSAVSAKP